MDSTLFDVVGLGYCSNDHLGIIPHIPSFDSNTVDLVAFHRDSGGPVATALAALAKLGVSTTYLGILGDDHAGRFMRQQLAHEGVDVRHLMVQPGGRSPVCIILVEKETGKRAITCYRGTLPAYQLDDDARDSLSKARILHIDGHWIEAVEEAAAIAHRAGATVVFDANRPRPHIDRFLACTDVLIASRTFPQAMTGQADLALASSELIHAGPRLVVTTLGHEGCYVHSEREQFHESGFDVPVLDTTGAGDAFHGGFIYGLLQSGWSTRQVARFANAVGALNCRALGARSGLPHLAEVLALLARQDGV